MVPSRGEPVDVDRRDPTAAIFRIAEDRHRDRLIELLGPDFQGIVTSDRWWAYDHLDPEHRQACWSHLQRDFRFHSEGLALQKEFGHAGLVTQPHEVAYIAGITSAWTV